jgi:cell wall assembly regulator SMI1
MALDAPLDAIRRELALATLPPLETLPAGLSEGEIQHAEARLGRGLPAAFRAWLKIANGPCIGPGGFFGFNTSRPGLDVERLLQRHEAWGTRGWLPVAGDGCGNFYITLNESSDPPIGFVEAVGDDRLSFVVASRMTLFIRLLLEKQRGVLPRWPFEPGVVLKLDPQLAELERQWRLPWQ